MYSVREFDTNPLIDIDRNGFDSINHPSIIRSPEWIENPLADFYMYFSHERGKEIRMAYSDYLKGPWNVYDAPVLTLRNSDFIGHIGSPDVHIDNTNNQIVMYYHGETKVSELIRSLQENYEYRKQRYGFRLWELPYRLFFNVGRSLYTKLNQFLASRNNTYYKDKLNSPDNKNINKEKPTLERLLWKFRLIPEPIQETKMVTSRDGIRFSDPSPILGPSWFRVFEYEGVLYALGRDGYIYRSHTSNHSFERVKQILSEHRHYGLFVEDDRLTIFFSKTEDGREIINLNQVELGQRAENWKSIDTQTLMTSKSIDWNNHSESSPEDRADDFQYSLGLRDPAPFIDQDDKYLFYVLGDHQKIGGAKLTKNGFD